MKPARGKSILEKTAASPRRIWICCYSFDTVLPFDFQRVLAYTVALAATFDYFTIAGPRFAMSARNLAMRLSPQDRVLDVGGFDQARDAVLAGFTESPPHWDIINGDILLDAGLDSSRYFDARTDRLPYADNSFDAVVCWETVEHLFNIRADGVVSWDGVVFACQEMARVLKPGGVWQVTTTNRFCPRTFWCFKNGLAPMVNAPTMTHMGHIFEFAGEDLLTLARSAGMADLDLDSFNAYDMHFDVPRAQQLAPEMAAMLGRPLLRHELYDTLQLFARKPVN